jgi:cytochrome c peroxidase
MTLSRRTLSLVAAVVALAALAAALVVVVRSDVNTTSSGSVGEEGGVHAPVAISAAQRAALRNAIEATNASPNDAELAAEGRDLFRSNAVAKDGESCNGCHTDGGSNADVGTTPHLVAQPGIANDFDGLRDPPSLYGVKDTAPYFWIGDTPTLEAVAVATIKNHFRNGVAQPDAVTAHQAVALATYMRTIEAPEGDFSQGTMSAAALRGQVLFQGKAGCVACHFGPDLTDNRLHDVLVPPAPMPAAPTGVTDDPGAQRPAPDVNGGKCPVNPLTFQAAVVANPKMCAFNTPTLRGIGRTAPYFHNGVKKTLADVVTFYDTQSIIAPLNLTPQEKSDLVEYLKAL